MFGCHPQGDLQSRHGVDHSDQAAIRALAEAAVAGVAATKGLGQDQSAG